MQSCCRAYLIYSGSDDIDLQPIMWIDNIQRELKLHPRYENMVP
jgi:hypothetical protein